MTRLCNSHHQSLYLYIVLDMGGLFATAVAAEVCRYGYIPTEEEMDAFHNWVQGVFALFLSLSADALFTSIFGSTLVSTPHAFHKSSL